MATKKKITRVEGGVSAEATPANSPAGAAPEATKRFVPTQENKAKATQFRVIASLLWLVAIAAQVVAIVLLYRPPVSMAWMIGLIAIDLAFVIGGALLWKRSNRLDPASKKNKFRFVMQSQLGLISAVVAFLPLIIFVLFSKNLDGKQKGIIGGIAAVALVIAGVVGTDFNPPSVEQYTEQSNRVEWLNNGNNHVYWTKSGTVFHIYSDCQYINTDRTSEIFEGTVPQARELKNINKLCSRCESRAMHEHALEESDYVSTEEPVAE